MVFLPEQCETDITPVNISIIITQKNNQPCLELRKTTTDNNLIKTILIAAFYEKPIIVQPSFRNKYKALSTLSDKGIIYRQGDQYYFNI